METKIFTNNATTKEQYLNFKNYIKEGKYLSHATYVAYYIFKHRLEGEERDKYLEDEVRHRCYKGLYNGRIVGSGGADTEYYAIPMFKNQVINCYNKYAEANENA